MYFLGDIIFVIAVVCAINNADGTGSDVIGARYSPSPYGYHSGIFLYYVKAGDALRSRSWYCAVDETGVNLSA